MLYLWHCGVNDYVYLDNQFFLPYLCHKYNIYNINTHRRGL